MIDRIQPVNNAKSELHQIITLHRGKKKCYAEIVRGCSSKNSVGLGSSEELASMDDLSKNSFYKMEIHNRVGKMGLTFLRTSRESPQSSWEYRFGEGLRQKYDRASKFERIGTKN